MKKKAAGTLTNEDRLNPAGNFSRSFSNILRRAGVSHRWFHDLRATFGTNMADILSLTKTKGLMLHKSVQTTARYYVRHDREKLAAEETRIVKNFM